MGGREDDDYWNNKYDSECECDTCAFGSRDGEDHPDHEEEEVDD